MYLRVILLFSNRFKFYLSKLVVNSTNNIWVIYEVSAAFTVYRIKEGSNVDRP